MKLLVITQKMDSTDPTLGFFPGWISEMSKRVDSITVICLEKGAVEVPDNVVVYSLGKEKNNAEHGDGKKSKLDYISRFYTYLSLIAGSYDSVFVHMNQEYVLLAGLYWRMRGIPVYLWRNHPYGNLGTRVAIALSTKVFCTSPASFTAQFSKTILMPAGIDTTLFRPIEGVVRKKYSLCMVGRIAPIKGIDRALEAVDVLILSGAQVSLSIIGSPQDVHSQYYDSLREYVLQHNLSSYIYFTPAVLPEKLPEIYSSHEICLNLTALGSFDKTIVEAASCGAIPLTSNQSLSAVLPATCLTGSSAKEISAAITTALDAHEQVVIQGALQKFVEDNSLTMLMEKLFEEMR